MSRRLPFRIHFAILPILAVFTVACSSDAGDGTEKDGGGLIVIRTDAADDTGMRADVADTGARVDAAPDGGADAGADTATCDSMLDPADFDSYVCDPICNTNCGSELACYYGNNPVAGTLTSCQSIGTVPEGGMCNFENNCAPGMVCTQHEVGYAICNKLCAPGDPDGCDENELCIGEPVGTCEWQCQRFPNDDCPAEQACLYYAATDSTSCNPIDTTAQVGDSCESTWDCDRDQICVRSGETRTCHARCSSETPCDGGLQCVQLSSNGQPSSNYACIQR